MLRHHHPTIYFYILASNEIFDTFLNLSNSLDELDKEFNTISTLFQSLEIPSIWFQSSLFNWKQVFILKDNNKNFNRIIYSRQILLMTFIVNF